MPLLLRGLEIEDFEIRQRIIETLSNNINSLSDDRQLSTYASTLVVAMLKNCTIVDAPEYVSDVYLHQSLFMMIYRKFAWQH